MVFGFKAISHLLEEASGFSDKNFGSILYKAISNPEITRGKVGWDGGLFCAPAGVMNRIIGQNNV